MIRKIKTDEYLKGYSAMTEGERVDYQRRVGEWLAGGGSRLYEMTDRPMARAQNIVQLSTRWSADDCRAFQDGAQLLSALVDVTDTWLPTQLYARSAFRAVRQMIRVIFHAQDGTGVPKGVLNGTFVKVRDTDDTVEYRYVENTNPTPDPSPTGAGSAYGQKRGQSAPTSKAAAAPLPSKGGAGVGSVTAATPAGKPQGTLPAGKAAGTAATKGAPVPVRPRHIDQYVHLLPEATQKRAANYGPLMRELDEARESLWLVMKDPHASDKDRQAWATKVNNLDREIGEIRKELDREWAKVVAEGRVTVDDLGQAHVVAVVQQQTGQDGDDEGHEPSKEDKAAIEREQSRPEVKAQIKALRCWLRDTRGPKEPGEKRDAYVSRWTEKYREMTALGGPETVTDAVKKAAELYGIDLAELDTNNHG